MTSHIRKWKEEKLEEVKKLAGEYPVIAIATLDGLPANIVSLLRKRLSGEAVIIVAKTRVLQMALKESKADLKALEPLLKESIAVIFSKKNPFELFSFVKKNKGTAFAREGDIANSDIVVQAGDTGLPPGPALAPLKAAGLKVKVAGPTIEISQDKVVAKKGEPIAPEIADLLSKLNIKPMKIGMKILGVLDKNEKQLYMAEVLDVDEEELFEKFTLAYRSALNLAVNAEYFNEKSVEILIMKAQREAKAVESATGAEPAGGETKKTEKKKELSEENDEESNEEKKKEEGQKEVSKEEPKEEPNPVEEKKGEAKGPPKEEPVPKKESDANETLEEPLEKPLGEIQQEAKKEKAKEKKPGEKKEEVKEKELGEKKAKGAFEEKKGEK